MTEIIVVLVVGILLLIAYLKLNKLQKEFDTIEGDRSKEKQKD